MKKIIAIFLALFVCLLVCGCKQEKKGNSSKGNSSVFIEENFSSNKVEIVGNKVVATSNDYGETLITTYIFDDNDRVVSASHKRTCLTEESAKNIYQTFYKMNQHASVELYTDIKLTGKVFSCNYTSAILGDYRNFSKQDLKEYLDNENLPV